MTDCRRLFGAVPAMLLLFIQMCVTALFVCLCLPYWQQEIIMISAHQQLIISQNIPHCHNIFKPYVWSKIHTATYIRHIHTHICWHTRIVIFVHTHKLKYLFICSQMELRERKRNLESVQTPQNILTAISSWPSGHEASFNWETPFCFFDRKGNCSFIMGWAGSPLRFHWCHTFCFPPLSQSQRQSYHTRVPWLIVCSTLLGQGVG